LTHTEAGRGAALFAHSSPAIREKDVDERDTLLYPFCMVDERANMLPLGGGQRLSLWHFFAWKVLPVWDICMHILTIPVAGSEKGVT
jgi:hypothetical protein